MLILNARDETKQASAREWLLHLPRLQSLQHVGLIILAEENCSNTWLGEFIDNPKYKIKFVFMVYGGQVSE